MKQLSLSLILFVFPATLPAYARNSKNIGVLSGQGTVLAVSEQQPQSNYVGDNPTDAPLQANVHEYDVSVRLNCSTYVGHYNSEFDFLPEILTPNRGVTVRVQKHRIFVGIPGEQEFEMARVGHPHLNSISCTQDH